MSEILPYIHIAVLLSCAFVVGLIAYSWTRDIKKIKELKESLWQAAAIANTQTTRAEQAERSLKVAVSGLSEIRAEAASAKDILRRARSDQETVKQLTSLHQEVQKMILETEGAFTTGFGSEPAHSPWELIIARGGLRSMIPWMEAVDHPKIRTILRQAKVYCAHTHFTKEGKCDLCGTQLTWDGVEWEHLKAHWEYERPEWFHLNKVWVVHAQKGTTRIAGTGKSPSEALKAAELAAKEFDAEMKP